MELIDENTPNSDSIDFDDINSNTPTPPKLRKKNKQTHRIKRAYSKQIQTETDFEQPALRKANGVDDEYIQNMYSYDSDSIRDVRTRNRYVPDKEYLYFYETILDTIHKNANRAINYNNASKVFRTDLTREISSYLNPGERKSANSVKVPIVERTHPTTGAVVRLPAYVPYKSDVGYNWTTSYGKVKVDKNGKINIPWNHDGFRYVKFPKSNNYVLQPIHTGYPSILPTSKSHTVRASKPRYKKTKTIIKKR